MSGFPLDGFSRKYACLIRREEGEGALDGFSLASFATFGPMDHLASGWLVGLTSYRSILVLAWSSYAIDNREASDSSDISAKMK